MEGSNIFLYTQSSIEVCHFAFLYLIFSFMQPIEIQIVLKESYTKLVPSFLITYYHI